MSDVSELVGENLRYRVGRRVIIDGASLRAGAGRLTGIRGPSGAGKSTLLALLGGLLRPEEGAVRLDGAAVRIGDLALRRRVGLVLQGYGLVSALTARENVAVPLQARRMGRAEVRRRTASALESVGLTDVAGHLVDELSGGQQQRVAVARALAGQPDVLLADEPTGELDGETAAGVFAALQTANQELGVTVLIVTHDDMVSEHVRRTIAIRDGRISTEVLRRTHTDEHGQEAEVAQEYSVLDRAGRLQLPGEFVSTLGLRDRVRLALEPDHVGVWPDRPDGGRADETDPGHADPEPGDGAKQGRSR